MKRKVHDIMTPALPHAAPVAYDIDQKKQLHIPVCPWCAKNIGTPQHLTPNTTIGALYSWLFDITAEHMNMCAHRNATEMMVEAEWKGGPRS